MTNYILRRRKLGRTSAREIARNTEEGIKVFRNDGRRYNHDTNKYERVAGGLPEDGGFVFRWGCTSVVPGNPTVVNKVEAISKVNDKAKFRKLLADADLAPASWLSIADFQDTAFVNDGYPVVVRRSYHAQGRHLHVCRNTEELRTACNRYGEGNYYISELINKVAEYRVCVIQGRAAWVARKTPADPSAVAWNVAQGGRFDNVNWAEWPLKAVKVSIEAFNLSGLDFGGVDVMVDAEGNCYVLEINSAMSLTSPYRQETTAKCFDYIIRNGKEPIALTEERGGWKKFIHPALSPEAIVV